jgi:hypothetical protein
MVGLDGDRPTIHRRREIDLVERAVHIFWDTAKLRAIKLAS